MRQIVLSVMLVEDLRGDLSIGVTEDVRLDVSTYEYSTSSHLLC